MPVPFDQLISQQEAEALVDGKVSDSTLGILPLHDARFEGFEAVVTTRADTFLIRLLGLRGYPIQRAAELCFEVRYPEGGGTPTIFAPLRD